MCAVWLAIAVPIAVVLIAVKWWGFPGRRSLPPGYLRVWWLGLLVIVVAVVVSAIHCR
jgi:hypothetical protein